MRRVALAFGIGVGLERSFQFIGNADVIDDQTTRLILEHTVDAGDGLHQVVALHGFVDIHGVATRSVKPR
ncbi:hypothetical protein D3C86_1665130 [compost metagenome]